MPLLVNISLVRIYYFILLILHYVRHQYCFNIGLITRFHKSFFIINHFFSHIVRIMNHYLSSLYCCPLIHTFFFTGLLLIISFLASLSFHFHFQSLVSTGFSSSYYFHVFFFNINIEILIIFFSSINSPPSVLLAITITSSIVFTHY